MKIGKLILAIPAGLLVLTFTITEVNAGSFKAKYYRECYQPITNVKALIKAGKSGLIYTGGPPANWRIKFYRSIGKGRDFGDDSTVVKHSAIIKGVAAFTSLMVRDHPEPNARFRAYSSHIIQEAKDLGKIQTAIGQTQDCYQTVYQYLRVAYQTNAITKKDTQKLLKEIQKGTKASGDILLKATNRMRINITAYAQALTSETDTLGMSLSSARKIAGLIEKTPSEGIKGYGTLTYLAEFSGIKTWQSANLTIDELTAISPTAGDDRMSSQEDKITKMMLPGLQKVGLSSEKYLELHSDIMGRIETQKTLERQVSVIPW